MVYYSPFSTDFGAILGLNFVYFYSSKFRVVDMLLMRYSFRPSPKNSGGITPFPGQSPSVFLHRPLPFAGCILLIAAFEAKHCRYLTHNVLIPAKYFES